MNEQNQFNQKANQTNSKTAAQAEPKTVINGKVVSLQQAQAAEAAFEAAQNKTGIQAHHDNSSEAVQAGQVAQNQSGAEAGAAQMYNQQAIRQTDVQSGQAHMEQHMNQAGKSPQQQEQEQLQQKMQAEANRSNQEAMQAQQAKGLRAQKKGE